MHGETVKINQLESCGWNWSFSYFS